MCTCCLRCSHVLIQFVPRVNNVFYTFFSPVRSGDPKPQELSRITRFGKVFTMICDVRRFRIWCSLARDSFVYFVYIFCFTFLLRDRPKTKTIKQKLATCCFAVSVYVCYVCLYVYVFYMYVYICGSVCMCMDTHLCLSVSVSASMRLCVGPGSASTLYRNRLSSIFSSSQWNSLTYFPTNFFLFHQQHQA